MLAIRGASALIGLVLGLGVLSGCSDRACLQWTSADGPCPSADQALAFMQGSDLGCESPKVTSVDGEGEFDGQACCYDVTEMGDADEERPSIDCVGSAGVGVGSGTPNPAGGTGAAFCGDVFCDPSLAESCETCPDDCGGCVCGDGMCTSDEACAFCPEDCGPCFCGDAMCTVGEDCMVCPDDCLCFCSDGICSRGTEDCSTCAEDCGVCDGCRVGDDGCVGCSEVLASCAPDLLCSRSYPIFDAVLLCACSACGAECPAACVSSTPRDTMECTSCMEASCSMELASCLDDTTLP